MRIGYVCSGEPGRVDNVLAAVAAAAARQGMVLAGTVQLTGPEQAKCDIVIKVLPEGPVRSVSVDLGPGVTGCRLDTAALEEVVMTATSHLPGACALVVNKFGKQEAVGRGLVGMIGEACDRGLPVLVGVAPEWLEAFLAFAGGMAQPLPDDGARVLDWLCAACARDAA